MPRYPYRLSRSIGIPNLDSGLDIQYQSSTYATDLQRRQHARPRFSLPCKYAITSTDAAQNPTRDTLVYGWVSTYCGRGTSEILRSCLFTIFLCVWTVLHRPIPRYQGPRAHSFRTKIVRSKTVPAIIVLIASELLIFTAVRDFQDAMQ